MGLWYVLLERPSPVLFCAVWLAACSVGANGKPGEPGVPGASGSNGSLGTNGADGQDGVDGSAGSADYDGDGITVERDCDDADASVGEAVTVYLDLDGDGFGHPGVQNYLCRPTDGWVDRAGDCDDTDPLIHPDATEVCDDLDNDCDDLIDDADDSTDVSATGIPLFLDLDGDGYGDSATEFLGCAAADGQTELGTDCNDLDDRIHPGAVEVCGDGVDDNCDGGAPECLITGDFVASDAPVSLTSTDSGSQAGFSLAAADLTGDGLLELVVGVPFADTVNDEGSGALYVHYGTTSWADASVEDGVELRGLVSADYGGYALASPGDVNGDGYDDLWTGDPGADEAYLLYGGGSAWADNDLATAADFTLTDGGTGYLLGYGVAALGDLNLDGLADIAVGEYRGGGSFQGKVYLLYGSTSLSGSLTVEDVDAAFEGSEASEYAGVESGSIGSGDFDGDGLLDLVVGAPGYDGANTNTGRAYVVYGGVTPFSGANALEDADVVVTATRTDGSTLSFGADLRGGSDYNGDGLADLAVAAYQHDVAAADDQFGRSLGRLDDVDGDGLGDLVCVAQGADDGTHTDVGVAYLFLGTTSASGAWTPSDAFATISGESSYERLGMDSLAADLDNNGSPDLILGASGSSSVRVFWGGSY
jgi:hypothetical protein